MTISSRTPEGNPHHCPVCGDVAVTEPSYPDGDSCCPRCGAILWWFRDRLADESVALDISLPSLGLDSLETVELVMELEEAFDLAVPYEEVAQLQAVMDVIRYIRRHRA